MLTLLRWVRENTEVGEPVLFLPNDGAYYYLTRRRSPTRFVMGHQIVGDLHRAEVLAALRERPPRYVVWDDEALRVDDIGDDLVFGESLMAFFENEYETAERFARFRVLRHRSASAGEAQGRAGSVATPPVVHSSP